MKKIILSERLLTDNHEKAFQLRTYDSLPQPKDSEMLVKVLYFTLDPVYRMWVSGAQSYLPKLEIGGEIPAFGLGRVVASKGKTKTGQLVMGVFSWSTYVIKRDSQLFVLPDVVRPVYKYLSLLGPTGLTAYGAMQEECDIGAGQVMLISSAASSTGLLAVQLAKMRQIKVIGLAGSNQKSQQVKRLGADYCLNYKTQNLGKKIKEIAPGGVDFYFDNVGQQLLDLAIQVMSHRAKILLCGATATYAKWKNRTGISNLPMAITKQLRFKGLLFMKQKGKLLEYWQGLLQLWQSGALESREQVEVGLQTSIKGVKRMQEGKNLGKIIIELSDQTKL